MDQTEGAEEVTRIIITLILCLLSAFAITILLGIAGIGQPWSLITCLAVSTLIGIVMGKVRIE